MKVQQQKSSVSFHDSESSGEAVLCCGTRRNCDHHHKMQNSCWDQASLLPVLLLETGHRFGNLHSKTRQRPRWPLRYEQLHHTSLEVKLLRTFRKFHRCTPWGKTSIVAVRTQIYGVLNGARFRNVWNTWLNNLTTFNLRTTPKCCFCSQVRSWNV